MFKYCFNVALFVLSLILFPKFCSAGFMLSFTESGNAGSFQFSEGTPYSVPIYLVQTNGESSLSTVGLFSAGATIDVSSITSLVGASLASHWTDPIANYADADLAMGRVTLEGVVAGVTPVKTANGSNAILIGQIALIAGTAGTTTNLTLSLDNNLPGINLLINNTKLAPSFANANVSNISAVPEPSSFALTLLAACAFRTYRVMRRKTVIC